MRISGRRAITVSIVAIITLSAVAAMAHTGAMGVVKVRMEMMNDISRHMKRIGKMVRGMIDFDPHTVRDAASAIADHAAEIPDHFPEGSIRRPSEALPEIWAEWDEFEAIASELNDDAAALASAAASADDVDELSDHFARIADNCKECHEAFRRAQ